MKWFLFIQCLTSIDEYYLVKANDRREAVAYLKKKLNISQRVYEDYFDCFELPLPSRKKFIVIGRR